MLKNLKFWKIFLVGAKTTGDFENGNYFYIRLAQIHQKIDFWVVVIILPAQQPPSNQFMTVKEGSKNFQI